MKKSSQDYEKKFAIQTVKLQTVVRIVFTRNLIPGFTAS